MVCLLFQQAEIIDWKICDETKPAISADFSRIDRSFRNLLLLLKCLNRMILKKIRAISLNQAALAFHLTATIQGRIFYHRRHNILCLKKK